VDEQAAAAEVEEQILPAPAHGQDPLSRNRLLGTRRYRVAQPALVYPEGGDAPALQVRRDAAQGGLDLG
jgi:hypothetical protein